MPVKPKYTRGFSSQLGQEFNKKVTEDASERKEEKLEEEKRQELIIEEEWKEISRQIQLKEKEEAASERKRKRSINLKSNKKTYCCCGQDRIGGKCAEAQLILKSYISSQDYASGKYKENTMSFTSIFIIFYLI